MKSWRPPLAPLSSRPTSQKCRPNHPAGLTAYHDGDRGDVPINRRGELRYRHFDRRDFWQTGGVIDLRTKAFDDAPSHVFDEPGLDRHFTGGDAVYEGDGARAIGERKRR